MLQVRESQQEVERLREELASSAESNRFQDFEILKICRRPLGMLSTSHAAGR